MTGRSQSARKQGKQPHVKNPVLRLLQEVDLRTTQTLLAMSVGALTTSVVGVLVAALVLSGSRTSDFVTAAAVGSLAALAVSLGSLVYVVRTSRQFRALASKADRELRLQRTAKERAQAPEFLNRWRDVETQIDQLAQRDLVESETPKPLGVELIALQNDSVISGKTAMRLQKLLKARNALIHDYRFDQHFDRLLREVRDVQRDLELASKQEQVS